MAIHLFKYYIHMCAGTSSGSACSPLSQSATMGIDKPVFAMLVNYKLNNTRGLRRKRIGMNDKGSLACGYSAVLLGY